MKIIVLEGRKEKTYGEFACLMKLSRVLKEEPIGLQEEEDNEKKQEYRCERDILRRKLIKSIQDFLYVLKKANITSKIEVKIIIKDMQFLMMIIIRMRIFIKSILPCFILEND